MKIEGLQGTRLPSSTTEECPRCKFEGHTSHLMCEVRILGVSASTEFRCNRPRCGYLLVPTSSLPAETGNKRGSKASRFRTLRAYAAMSVILALGVMIWSFGIATAHP